MKDERRSDRPSSSPSGTTEPRRRRFVEGTIVEVLADGRLLLVTATGNELRCRKAQHIDVAWVQAALALGPVAAEGSMDAEEEEGSIWCLFPTAEQEAVQVAAVEIQAAERLSLRCGKSTLTFTKSGQIELRGRDVTARGSRATRIAGGTVRLN